MTEKEVKCIDKTDQDHRTHRKRKKKGKKEKEMVNNLYYFSRKTVSVRTSISVPL